MSTEKEIVKGIIEHGVDIVENCVLDLDHLNRYLFKLEEEKLNYKKPKLDINPSNWFMPSEYKNIDIEEFLVNKCPEENYERLIKELEEYRKRNLLDLLRQMKYIVDTLKENHVIWGVGRGSSVASYVLFLLNVHKIDSVKYDLPLEEFFKES
jgi:DNA polymerase III alpha subunit